MSIEIDEIIIPVFKRNLEALNAMLKKGESYTLSEGLDLDTLVEAKLAEDMHPLNWQVQKSTESVIGLLSELGGINWQKKSEPLNDYHQLRQAVNSTLEFVLNFEPKILRDAEQRTIKFETAGGTIEIDGLTYVSSYGLPNFYFHLAGAYNILRVMGVKISKLDFLGDN